MVVKDFNKMVVDYNFPILIVIFGKLNFYAAA